jgi:hypothetical protein
VPQSGKEEETPHDTHEKLQALPPQREVLPAKINLACQKSGRFFSSSLGQFFLHPYTQKKIIS